MSERTITTTVTVPDYNLSDVLAQLDEAQRKAALLETMNQDHIDFKTSASKCEVCHDMRENLKIVLDSAHTNLRDIMGLEKEEL